jgi:DNA modification methylase
MMTTWTNQLYFGDNLHVLRNHIPDESVDLIYLDPPFNSNATYNVLFKERSGEDSAAQITAFDDTWHWTIDSERAYQEVVTEGPDKLGKLLQAMREFLGQNDMMAYLTMMAQRLAELHRVLKPTGSIYLHCDPTASHFIKLLLDAIFGARNFLNEFVWKRTSAHNDTEQGMRRAGRIHDVVFLYTKTDLYVWNQQWTPYTEEYLEEEYRHQTDDGRHYKETDVTARKPGGDTEYPWPVKRRKDSDDRWEPDFLGEYANPVTGWEYKDVYPYRNRYWAYSKANLVRFWEEGRLVHRRTGMPRLMQFADEMPGVALQDIWTDIPPALGDEDLGYDTQKPEELLERIINASSNEGDVVLDPFCGCGTAVAVAEEFNRRWIGIDITHLAISLMKHRLHDTFGSELSEYSVIGLPEDVESARALATESEHDGRYQFEYWALGLVDARPATGKKGADSGIDGYINFFDDNSGKAKRIIVQVKSGHVNRGMVATLKGDMDAQDAAIGIFITLEEPTEPMRQAAISAGFYEPEGLPGNQYPRVQILTIEQLLDGAQPEYPRFAAPQTFRKAPRRKRQQGVQQTLDT